MSLFSPKSLIVVKRRLTIRKIDGEEETDTRLKQLFCCLIEESYQGFIRVSYRDVVTVDIRPVKIEQICREIKSRTGEAMWTTWKIVEL